MTQSKQYNYRVVQDEAAWSVEIIRQVTSRVTVISKQQGGFSTEQEAQEWGEKEVKAFIQKSNLSEQNKRRSRKKNRAKKGWGNSL